MTSADSARSIQTWNESHDRKDNSTARLGTPTHSTFRNIPDVIQRQSAPHSVHVCVFSSRNIFRNRLFVVDQLSKNRRDNIVRDQENWIKKKAGTSIHSLPASTRALNEGP